MKVRKGHWIQVLDARQKFWVQLLSAAREYISLVKAVNHPLERDGFDYSVTIPAEEPGKPAVVKKIVSDKSMIEENG